MNYYDLFIKAVKFGDVEDFHQYYKQKYLDKAHKWNQRPIHIACLNGHVEIVKILIKKNCDIEACDQRNWRPIHHGCCYGPVEIVQMLIDKKCDIEAFTENNERPIHIACLNGHVEIVQILIDRECDVEALTTRNQLPLDIAKENENKRLIKILKKEMKRVEEHKLQIKRMILSMDLKCDPRCDHKLCSSSLLSKKFAKGRLIGRGSFGKVYQCKESQTTRKFAIKVEPIDNTNENSIEKNINQYLCILNHERIVQYFGAIKKLKCLYIFMEFLPKGSLQNKIKKEKSINKNMIIHFSKQILEGLEFLHANKIIHRDIKPANVLLDQEDNVKLADFGLGRSLTKTDGQTTNATTFCGTANFMAPEIIIGEQYTFSVDIWSVGATIINMITGKPPYHELVPQAVVFKIASNKKIELPPSESMPSHMKSFITKMLNSESSERPSASDLLKSNIFFQ